ncbi:MAG: alanine--glyoxylate aminotransferase family protein [Granulosicoccus sp.]
MSAYEPSITGRDHLAIPGPSVVPDRVLRAMHRAAPNIYGSDLSELTSQVLRDLKRLANCTSDVAMYIGNGHALWEAALCNTLSRGDRVLALVNGRFGRNWAAMAKQLQIDVEVLDFGDELPVDPEQVKATLKADSTHSYKAVLVVQTDTSTSVSNDVESIGQAIEASGHPALYLVDCIASFCSEPFDMQSSHADVMVAGSQKGLMCPPGVGVVFLSERGWAAHATAGLNTPYWNWGMRSRPEEYWQHFFGTAPTHHLFALQEALTMLDEEGLQTVWARHRTLAGMVWQAVDCWSQAGNVHFQIGNAEHRSTAVTTLRVPEGKAKALRDWAENALGVTLGVGMPFSGSGPAPADDRFRIGHMGHLNAPMLLGTLGAIDAALKALNIPHGHNAMENVCQYLAREHALVD